MKAFASHHLSTFALFARFLVVLTLSVMLVSLPEIGKVKAEPKMIVVPDDYPTITEAVRNAGDGDVVFVENGTYEEKTLEIDKRLSLIGEGAEFTKINLDPPIYTSTPDAIGRSSSWFGHSITVEADDFKLSGFTINTPNESSPGGDVSITGNRTQLTDNSIKGDVNVYGSHSNITDNKFSGTIRAFGSYLNISANSKTESNNLGTLEIGINLDGSFCIIYGNNISVEGLCPAIRVNGDGNTVARNIVDHASVGMRIVGSGNIICANRITNSGVSSGLFPSSTAHSEVGIIASGNNTIYANYLADNQWGTNINEFPDTDLTSTLHHNNFINNVHQVAAVDEFVYGFDNFDNSEEGNYWSDYSGIDDNGDGIGDTPYVIDINRTDRYPLMAPFNISTVHIELPKWASPNPLPSEPVETEEPAEPTGSEEHTEAPLFTTTNLAIIAAVAAPLAVTVAIILLFKKRNS